MTDSIIYGFYVHHRASTEGLGVPFYVGKGPSSRAYSLKRNNKHHSYIVSSDGPKNIQVTWTACHSEKEALCKEIALIKLYRDLGIELVNVTDGGDGVSGWVPSEETRKRISQANKGRKWTSEESRKRLSDFRKNYKASEELKKKLSQAQRGKKMPPEAIEKTRLAHLGSKRSAESRAKMSAAAKNRKFSAKHRKKISEANKGKRRTLEQKERYRKCRLGKAHSAQRKKNISLAVKRYYQKGNSSPRKGVKLSEDIKKKISQSILLRNQNKLL